MSLQHTFNQSLNQFEQDQGPQTPPRGLLQARSVGDNLPSPPPAPKAPSRAYRLTDDERRKREISGIARRLTFGESQDEEGRRKTAKQSVCSRDQRRRDHDGNGDYDDGHSMLRLEATTRLGSPIIIHPAHSQPPIPSSSQVIGNRKRTISNVWDDEISIKSQTQQNQSNTNHNPSTSVQTPFLLELHRTASHSGMNVEISDFQQIEPSSMRLQPFKIQQFIDSSCSSSMQRSVSYSSYLVRTPNEIRATKSSKVIMPPRLPYGHYHQTNKASKQSNISASTAIKSSFSSQSKGSSSHCHRHQSPFSISSNSYPSSVISTLSNTNTVMGVPQAQPIDYFGNWSAASSPLTRAH